MQLTRGIATLPDYIIGFYAGHNASACIGYKGELVYAIQEERLTGEKNYWGVPANAIQACLRHTGAKPRDLCAIVHGGNRVSARYHSRDDVLRAYRRHGSIVGRIRQRLAMPIILAVKPTFGQSTVLECLAKLELEDVPTTFYDHHTSHAASAYYGLRKQNSERHLVLTCDGSGDTLSATVRVMGPEGDNVVATTSWHDSLGAIYSWVTFGLGFVPLEHEYKLMGMAPYAPPEAAEQMAQVFHKYLGMDGHGLGFKRRTRRRTNDLIELLLKDLRGKRFDYICAGLQHFTENILCDWSRNAVIATGIRDVLGAGGVFMNVKANKRIAELSEVNSFQAFPSCGDETLSIGAFYLEAAKQFGNSHVASLKHFYLGDDITPQMAERAANMSECRVVKPSNVAVEVATILASGQPIARCAGRMEFGARALGNRSILADPRNHDVVRVINQMVKKRDFWMPFAPMVRTEDQQLYLRNPKNLTSPFMMMTFDTRENFRDIIAAVHNADLTCRAQILTRDNNPEMYDILDAFHRLTGRGVILNTSFNLHGFPIVRTADEAVDVLRRSGLEHLQIGEYILSK